MRVVLPKIPLPLLPLLQLHSEPLDEPIRAELFGIERMEQHAESLAVAQKVTGVFGLARPLLPRVEENGRALRESNRAISAAVAEEGWITPAAEWLVDNFYVVDEQLREIRDDLPIGFYRELPVLADGHLAAQIAIAGEFQVHMLTRSDEAQALALRSTSVGGGVSLTKRRTSFVAMNLAVDGCFARMSSTCSCRHVWTVAGFFAE